ncbi:MAG TPA: hypothetical protein VI776_11025 [Anaerolineales bacterium]|jgi:hypothetical protein|nr:hypothetical protein [Anaerolineales bacterium]
MSTEIARQLDQLANYRAEREVLGFQKQELIDQVLTPEIKARLEEIEAEFSDRFEAVDQRTQALEEEVRAEVIRHGGSVKGTFLRAIWHRGRVTWDASGMDRYADAHPEILRFRKQGDPFVSITKVDR